MIYDMFMKVGKYITLDTTICEKLEQEPNVSGLINQLLRQHFEMQGKNLQQKIKEFQKNYKKTLKMMKKEAEIYQKQSDKYAKMKLSRPSDQYRRVIWEAE